MEVEEFVPPECLVLQQCTFCSRKFRADVLAKHIKICQKVSKRKAKVFDSGKQRATGTGIPLSKTIRPGRVVPDEMKDDKIIRAENKKNNWRMKHEEFIRNIRAAKQYTVAKAKGRPLPPPPMPSQTINEDLVQCEYCQRRFNEKAAERHIAFCREQQSRMRIVAGKPKKPTSTVKPKVPEPRYVASKPTTQVVSGPHRPPNATRGASSQVRVDASPGPSTTSVHSPPSRGSFVVSPQRGSTGSSGAKPQMTQVATGDSSQLATGSMMSVKRGVPYPRRTPEGRYADESQKCTKLELPPITEPVRCGFRDNSRTQSILTPCGDVASSKPRLRPCLPGRQMRFKPDRPLRSAQKKPDSHLPASDYRFPPTDLDKNHVNQSIDDQTAFSSGLPLRSGRTYQDYVDAHTFARDLARSRLKPSPTKSKQPSAASRIDTSLRRGVSEQQFLEPISYEHCNSGSGYAVGNESGHNSLDGDRAVGLSLNGRLPLGNCRNSTKVCSGIPVRATNKALLSSVTAASQARPQPAAQVSGDVKSRFCPECGARLPNAATRFCPGCGVRRMAV